MKRLTKIGLGAFAAAALAFPSIAAAASWSIATGDVHLRTGPSVGYPIIATIPQDGRVLVFECRARQDWCRVSWRGTSGWMSGHFLALASNHRQTAYVQRPYAPYYPAYPAYGGPYLGGYGSFFGGPVYDYDPGFDRDRIGRRFDHHHAGDDRGGGDSSGHHWGDGDSTRRIIDGRDTMRFRDDTNAWTDYSGTWKNGR